MANPVIDTHRLFSAADVLLKALDSEQGVHTLIPMYMEGSGKNEPRPDIFTASELIEAMAMLNRMGFCEDMEDEPES